MTEKGGFSPLILDSDRGIRGMTPRRHSRNLFYRESMFYFLWFLNAFGPGKRGDDEVGIHAFAFFFGFCLYASVFSGGYRGQRPAYSLPSPLPSRKLSKPSSRALRKAVSSSVLGSFPQRNYQDFLI